ncbi:MAG: hypothetical protein IKT83_05105 [Bacteroidaceae bacterium]|nr:hypothetical protein [Bacteroidaceae bacterium]
MKKKLLLAVCILYAIATPLWAQNEEPTYYPFAEEGKEWMTQIGGLYENRNYGYFMGDTVIDGKTWTKVYTERIILPHRERAYYAAVRDEGKKVYAIAKGSDKPRLLYDFSLNEGDFIRCGIEKNIFGCLREKDEPRDNPVDTLFGFPFAPYLKVDRIDIVKLRDGLNYRRFTLTMWDERMDIPIATPIVWIEGLGSGAGPFLPWMLQSPTYPHIDSSRICITYWSNANTPLITTSDEMYELDGTTTEIYNLSSKYINDASYDLQGRQIGKPQKGVNIIRNTDGKTKKVLVE